MFLYFLGSSRRLELLGGVFIVQNLNSIETSKDLLKVLAHEGVHAYMADEEKLAL